MGRSIRCAFWLVPAAEDRSRLQRLIDDLASRYDGPTFVPHVTLYVADIADDESPAEMMVEAAHGVRPDVWPVSGCGSSARFTKTLFLTFNHHPRFSSITEGLRDAGRSPSDYILEPHLSLLYAEVPEAERRTLEKLTLLPREPITFSELWAVAVPATVRERADVECWEDLCRINLQ